MGLPSSIASAVPGFRPPVPQSPFGNATGDPDNRFNTTIGRLETILIYNPQQLANDWSRKPSTSGGLLANTVGGAFAGGPAVQTSAGPAAV